MDILNRETVLDEDVYFLPAGRVHTIGKGLLITEIQQTSDITYRIYDFDRTDDQGNKRELHVDEALDAIDYNYYDEYRTNYDRKLNEVVQMVSCQYFTTNKLYFNTTVVRNHSLLDCFKILICVEGALKLDYDGGELSLQKGDAILIPASIRQYKLKPSGEFKVLESYID